MFCSLLMIFVLLFVLVLLLYVNGRAKDALENERVRQEYASAQADLQLELDAALGDLNAALGDLDAARADLDRQSRDAQAAEAQLSSDLALLRQQAADLERQLAGLEQENSDQSLILSSVNRQLDRSDEALTQARMDLAAREEQIADVRADLANAYAQAAQLEADLTVVRSGKAELEGQIADLEAELTLTRDNLSAREEEIRTALNLHGDQAAVLSALQTELDAARIELEDAYAQIDAANAQIETITASAGEENVTLSLRIAELEDQLDAQSSMIESQEQAIQAVAGIRLEIISQIRAALDAEGIEARVDQETGAIVLSSELLFGVNEAEIRPAGREFLAQFFPVYFDVLAHGQSADSIAQIQVEGHTDTTGDYLSNLDLSMRRAQSVVTYCISLLEGEDRDLFIAMAVASGCSYSNPIYAEDGSVDMDRSRRVEVKFTLKDQYMIDEIRRIVEQ